MKDAGGLRKIPPPQQNIGWRGAPAVYIWWISMAHLPASRRTKPGAAQHDVEAVGTDIPVQFGGGIRDLETIERYLDIGVTYIIIGTAAVKVPGFLLCQ